MGPSAPTRPLDETDRQMLAFAAEHRFAVTGQLAAVVSLSPGWASRRIRRLADAGLLASDAPLRHQPAAHQITPAGLRAIASDLPRPQPVDLALYRHDLGLAWLMVLARRGRFGTYARVVGEREMRSHDGRFDLDSDPVGTRRLGVLLPGEGPGGGSRMHYPDLLLVTPQGRHVAIELELSTKTPGRRERILKAYRLDPRVDAVLYLVPTRAAGRAIAQSAARVGVSDLVHVQSVRFPDGRRRGGWERARGIERGAGGRPGPEAGR